MALARPEGWRPERCARISRGHRLQREPEIVADLVTGHAQGEPLGSVAQPLVASRKTEEKGSEAAPAETANPESTP